MRHSEVYKELQSELDAAASQGQLSYPVTYADAIKLPLLSACIKEGMRMHPSVGLSMTRLAPAQGFELCGTYIPHGFRVGMNPSTVQYDRAVFGEDADHYRPSRWLGPDAALMEKSMLQFGAGTRTCIGKNVSNQWQCPGLKECLR